MLQIRIFVIFAVMLAASGQRYGAKLTPLAGHKLNKREDVVNKHQRDPGKISPLAGKLQPIPELTPNTTRLYDVKTLEGRTRGMRNYTQSRNYHGLVLPQLAPPNHFAHRSYNVRSQKLIPRDGRYRGRYNSRMRNQRFKQPENLGSSFSRWFFADDSEESTESKGPTILARHSSHRPSTYHNYPPYWQFGPGPAKFNSFSRFQKSRAVNHRPVTNNKINFVKKDCSACNSVPWTPILKPSAVHHESFDNSQSYGVPTIEVHHDSSAYDTTHQQKVVAPPSSTLQHTPDSTIPASYGLPIGNIPTAHGLLPPINHVKTTPTGLVPPPPTLLSPVPAGGLLPSIPFPELSPIPIVPLHDSNHFLQVDTADLVPPVPPPKSVSNVVLTISENGPGPNDGVIDNHLGHTGSFHGLDQHSESSSYVGTHFQSHIQRPLNQYNPANNHVNLDIVKSVPVAEFTSSIQYPVQIIQSPQYIDITTAPNVTKTDTPTYEKQPQTGSQKISDILFGLVKDSTPKQIGAESSVNNVASQSVHQAKPQQIDHYLPTNLPLVADGQKSTLIDSSSIYSQNQQYNTKNLPLVADGQKSTLIDSSSIYSQNQQYNTNLIFNSPPSGVWSEHAGRDSQSYVQPSPDQPKLEPGNDNLFPDPTSTSWLIPAQSNLAPQWILPVSNPPSIPYPLLPEEEGIASAVNEELSPTPPPQPMNDPKGKKIQIIIPYTTGDNNKNYDQTILETAQSEIYKTTAKGNITQVVQHKEKHTQGRKVPGQKITEFSVPVNATQNNKFINDIHHILALNIKDLLQDEVEKPKAEQNIRLQKNIDNWTALEYSNHKTIAKKEPQDVISYANSVTSIPGNSISHILLSSKKIPDKYLTTTPLPKFDEPTTTHFAPASSVSVESKPFTTKTYDTSSLYSTVTRIAPTTTTLRSIVRDVLKENKNHRNGYTEVVKTKANQWGKLNENLVLPENVSNRSTTPAWSTKKSGSQGENVYVVTPVSVWQTSKGEVSKRTTRQVFMTEKPELENVTISPEATKSYIAKLFGNKTERAKISKFNKPKLIQKFFPTTKATPRNITKVEIKEVPNSKARVHVDVKVSGTKEKKSINDVFPFRNGGELPLELAVVNLTTTASTIEAGETLVKKFETSKNLGKTKKYKDSSSTEKAESAVTTTEVLSSTIADFAVENTTVEPIENSTEIIIEAEESGFGLKIAKEDKKKSNNTLNSIEKVSKKEQTNSNLPPGIFGETKKVHITRDEDSPSDITSINETIRLLKEYLKDTSDELPQDKTEGTQYFKEEDRP